MLDAAADLRASTMQRTPLVDPAAWAIASSIEDPFADRFSDATCPDGTHMTEWLADEAVFSVDTSGCNYVTARQSTLQRVAAGDALIVRVWHFALNASGSATAHVAVRIGELRLLDREVPIPSPGGLLRVVQLAQQPIPKGTPVYFHLHNHGDNSWSFVELSTGPPTGAP